MRQIVLDTETTGLEVGLDHRIIEIGCVEVLDRRLTRKHYHQYVNPERQIDEGALEVHGITADFLSDKPRFSEVWKSFLAFVEGAELVIHNSAFDVGFLNHEMARISRSLGKIEDYCSIVDSLALARQKHPGQRNSLDALCKRYHVDNSKRDLHGALLDAEILADVYLLLTGGQVGLNLDGEGERNTRQSQSGVHQLDPNRPRLKVLRATVDELVRHEEKLKQLDKAAGTAVWRQLEEQSS